jgi:ParB/RepB/Spo0J family partition protein
MAIEVTPLGLIPISMVEIKERFRKDKGEIDLMAADLQENGQVHPIVVAPVPGKKDKYILLAGERRVLGALQAKWETIRAELRVGDNSEGRLKVERSENVTRKPFHWAEQAALEKAIWEIQIKKDRNHSLRKQAEMRDVGKSQIHRRIELAEAIELLPELAEAENEQEAYKQYKKLEEAAGVQILRAKISEEVKQAPIWAREHYIVGDALAGLKSLPSEEFHFAEIDPPYAIDLVRRKSRNADEGHTGDYNEIGEAEYPDFIRTVIKEVHRTLKPNSFAVFWFGYQWYTKMYLWLVKEGFQVNSVPGIWYKSQSGQTAQPDIALASCYEPFFLARKGQPRMMKQGRANVFHYAPIPPSRKIHPTERPPELLDSLLETICFPGSKILVPFLGSGATLRAAYRGGHTGLGYDLAEGNKQRFLDAVAVEFGGATPTAPSTDIGDEEE